MIRVVLQMIRVVLLWWSISKADNFSLAKNTNSKSLHVYYILTFPNSMNLFRNIALLFFVTSSSAAAQYDTVTENGDTPLTETGNMYNKFLRQAHGQKRHDDHQHPLMPSADVKKTASNLMSVYDVKGLWTFNDLVDNTSKEQLVVIEIFNR